MNNPPLVTVTLKAAALINKMLDNASFRALPGGIRFYIKAGGCSGFTYEHRLEKTEDRFDHLIYSHGARILIDKKSMKFMEGTIIDHTDNLLDPQFVFTNPNATSTCGCGVSFELKDKPTKEK